MDFMNAPVPYAYGAVPPQQMMQMKSPVYQQQMQRQQDFNIPTVVTSGSGGNKRGFKIHVVDDQESGAQLTLHEPGSKVAISNELEERTTAKKRSKKSKSSTEESALATAEGVNAFNQPSEALQGSVEASPTAYTYAETTMMLRDTLAQIDAVNRDLVQEFNAIRNNRTLKNKHSVMIGLSENIGSFIGNRISAIREINSSISKSNDLDYKKYKDIQAANSQMNDDKYVAEMYKAFLSNPQGQPSSFDNMPIIDPSVLGSGIVRAGITENNFATGNFTDAGYLQYMANKSPEQNLMMYEGNPDVKQVVVYDAASGYKAFQMMNMKTGEVVPNVPVYDQMFMEDTTLDLDKGIARNLNLNETFPIIVLNDSVTSNY